MQFDFNSRQPQVGNIAETQGMQATGNIMQFFYL